MAQLIGVARLGRDAEVRHTKDGKAVADLSLAFSYGKKQDGKQPTQWVKGSLWRDNAEAIAQYLTKGQQLYVVLNDVHIQTFQKNDGTQGTALAATVSMFEFVGSQAQPQEQQRAAPPPPQRQRPAAPPANIMDMDDSIPF